MGLLVLIPERDKYVYEYILALLADVEGGGRGVGAKDDRGRDKSMAPFHSSL